MDEIGDVLDLRTGEIVGDYVDPSEYEEQPPELNMTSDTEWEFSFRSIKLNIQTAEREPILFAIPDANNKNLLVVFQKKCEVLEIPSGRKLAAQDGNFTLVKEVNSERGKANVWNLKEENLSRIVVCSEPHIYINLEDFDVERRIGIKHGKLIDLSKNQALNVSFDSVDFMSGRFFGIKLDEWKYDIRSYEEPEKTIRQFGWEGDWGAGEFATLLKSTENFFPVATQGGWTTQDPPFETTHLEGAWFQRAGLE